MNKSSFSKRIVADELNKVNITLLKKEGLLTEGFKSGTISWKSRWHQENSIKYKILVSRKESLFQISHFATKENLFIGSVNQDFPLTTTPCFFGGKRYWFICNNKRNGTLCSRRVGILFQVNIYFACRHCYALTYESRNFSKNFRPFSRALKLDKKIEEVRKSIKRSKYAGKPTTRHKLLYKLITKYFVSTSRLLKH